MNINILFSGGGSLGHIVPSVAVADELKRQCPNVAMVFVCADRSEEIEFLTHASYPFHSLRAPKLPRGLSLSLLSFPFLFLWACFHAATLLLAEKPQLIFSKGGFVSVPLCLAGWFKKIPIVLHESDGVMSLSSRLIARFAVTVCAGFPAVSVPNSLKRKVRMTGLPVRPDILRGSKTAGQRITGFSGRRPVVLIIGGSQGSAALNQAVAMSFERLINLADIIHLTGPGKATVLSHARYFARPSVIEELPHLYALADVVVSRAGAGVLSELAVLRKPVIIVPLAGIAHDHQVRNATLLSERGAGILLEQEALSCLPDILEMLLADESRRRSLGDHLSALFPVGAAARIVDAMLATVGTKRLQS